MVPSFLYSNMKEGVVLWVTYLRLKEPCNHYYNGKFMFDPSDPGSRCAICGALCKDIFHVGKYEDQAGLSIKTSRYIKKE